MPAKDKYPLLSSTTFRPHWHRLSNPTRLNRLCRVRLLTAKTRAADRVRAFFLCIKPLHAPIRLLKLRGPERIAEVVRGVQFKNGVREDLKKIAA